MDTNTVQLIESFGTKLDSYIQAIATKAGVATDHFYPVFVRQQAIEGVSTLVLTVLAIVTVIVMYRIFSKNIPIANSGEEDAVTVPATIKSAISGIVGLLMLLGVVFSIPNVQTAVSKLLNPEYHVVQSLVKLVK